MSKTRIVPPTLNDTLDAFKLELFRDINCVRPGVVQSVDLDAQSVTVKLTIKEWLDSVNNVSVEYPILTDVPFFVLQGGGAFLELPVTVGDSCLVLFSDRDIDNWWLSGNEGTTPNTLRKHSLSDGLALVGVNPKSMGLDLTGFFRLFGGAHKVDVANNAQALSSLMASMFTNIDALFTDLNQIITDIKAIITVGSSTTQVVSPTSQAALAADAASLSTLKGNFDTLKSNFTQLLGSS